MTKISTRRPDGTFFGQNSAPVGFSVDLSEPLVCVFRGASRPCARFARDENLDIFESQKNIFLNFDRSQHLSMRPGQLFIVAWSLQHRSWNLLGHVSTGALRAVVR